MQGLSSGNGPGQGFVGYEVGSGGVRGGIRGLNCSTVILGTLDSTEGTSLDENFFSWI